MSRVYNFSAGPAQCCRWEVLERSGSRDAGLSEVCRNVRHGDEPPLSGVPRTLFEEAEKQILRDLTAYSGQL